MPKPVNAARGEIKLQIGEKEFVLLPEYDRFALVEDAIGCGVFKAMEKLQSGSFVTAVGILWAASGTELTRAELADLVLANGGLGAITGPLYHYIAVAATGFRRVQEVLEKTKEEPGAAGEAEEDPEGSKSGE